MAVRLFSTFAALALLASYPSVIANGDLDNEFDELDELDDELDVNNDDEFVELDDEDDASDVEDDVEDDGSGLEYGDPNDYSGCNKKKGTGCGGGKGGGGKGGNAGKGGKGGNGGKGGKGGKGGDGGEADPPLTPKQLTQMHADLDSDSDGKGSFDEFMAHNSRVVTSDAHIGPIFSEIDSDGDGEVTLKEFLADVKQQVGPGGKGGNNFAQEKAAFKKADVDGDGRLAQDELARIMHPEAHGDKKAEKGIRDGMKSLFKVADKDGDGHLTAKEMVAARKQIQESEAMMFLELWARVEL